ncbi:MAG TPA: glycosyltransferase family 39 protein [Candidatus Angelobacter sp.]|nr:glycosyltransferase family 39 protein [Candidatus Angelobacter sp.]
MNARARLVAWQLAIVLIACAFLFFFGLGAFGLVGADEPRYAQIAREMAVRHDWVVPTLNGAPWLEKPALLYWKIINSYAIFGFHDWAARIPAASHALVLVVAAFFFMRRFRPGTEMNAALITASCAAIIGFGRGASTDMLLSAPFCIALLAWWTWHETEKKVWLAVFYGLLAIGALAKGPVAPALAVLIVGAYAAVRRDAKIFLRTLWWPGFVLFFAMVLPWFIAIQLRVPNFFRSFFIEHNLQRFGTNRYQHSQPVWYYLIVFVLSTLPWTIFVLSALVSTARDAIRKIKNREETTPSEEAGGNSLPFFFLLWTLIPVLFFSVSRSKLPGYILPAIPAAALLTADWLHRAENALSRVRLVLHAVIGGALVAGALLAPWFLLKVRPPSGVLIEIIIAAIVIGLMVLLMVLRGGPRVLHFATLLPVVLAMGYLLRVPARAIDQAISARAVDARMAELNVPNDVPIAVFNVRRDIAYGLNFYRNQPIHYYEQGSAYDLPSGIPAERHVVVAREGSLDAVQAAVGDREVTLVGRMALQHLEFFLVSNTR